MTGKRIRIGSRGSTLARRQTGNALAALGLLLPEFCFEEVFVSSPGDRDLKTDLRESPGDFFTRDLDEAVLAGELDGAIHSAKDLPDPVTEGLDWFWLPWREDPRDVLVLAPGRAVTELPADPVVGISSDRRDAYCRARFPGARMKPIRGTIEQRLAQLDAGEYDLVIMAAAALLRLDLVERITEWIPLDTLPTPDGQGVLAMTFKAGNPLFLRLRSLAVNAVTFAGGGAGVDSGTIATRKALARCDVCLHDTLLDHSLLAALPPHARLFDVGKRCAGHSVPQAATTEAITLWARRGARVVRLKGGDPGVFGRLAEEVTALDALHLPYRVLPGVSSLNAATTGTGILLTQRGVSRGFCVMTPRKQGGGFGSVGKDARAAQPTVFFMAVNAARDVADELMREGTPADTPAAMVFNAGADDQAVVRGTLGDICDTIAAFVRDRKTGDEPDGPMSAPPGLFIVGRVAADGYRTDLGALEGRRVLLTCSEALQDKAAARTADFGGVPIRRPLIRLKLTDDAGTHIRRLERYEWVVLTSPSAADCFLELLRREAIDLRRIPRLLVCGSGTAGRLERAGLRADAQPDAGFSAEAVVEAARPHVTAGTRVLRLRSSKAGGSLAEALRELGADVDDCVLYRNETIAYDARPEFDDVFFASASAVEAFVAAWGAAALAGKTVVAIGQPTLAALRRAGLAADVVGAEATIESGVESLAAYRVHLAAMRFITWNPVEG